MHAGPDTLLTPVALRTMRSAIACTVDSIMHAMQCSMRRTLDKASDACVAKFVSERLPPLWLQGAGDASNVAKVELLSLIHI